MVIAIIAILAAILFPVFARARENARKSSCMSNLKQMGTGFQMYAQDYDERWVRQQWVTGMTQNASGPLSTNPAPSMYFWWCLQPYVKNLQIFHCPSDSTANYNSYGYNMWLNCQLEAAITSQTYGITDRVAVTDARNNWIDNANCARVLRPGATAPAYPDPRLLERHLDVMNVLFADGHVKSQKGSNLRRAQWNPGWANDSVPYYP